MFIFKLPPNTGRPERGPNADAGPPEHAGAHARTGPTESRGDPGQAKGRGAGGGQCLQRPLWIGAYVSGGDAGYQEARAEVVVVAAKGEQQEEQERFVLCLYLI